MALSQTNFAIVKDNMQQRKSCYQGLGCLSWLHNDLSIPGLRIDPASIEGLGRKLWATQNGPWANRPPQLANSLGLPVDGFWDENEVSFPTAWPEKLTLPIGITDLSNLPGKGKLRLLALEEAVLSFWQFVQHCFTHRQEAQQMLQKLIAGGGNSASLEGQSSAKSPEGQSSSTCVEAKQTLLKEKIDRMTQQIERAHDLSRNVTFALWYIENEEDCWGGDRPD